MANEIQVDYTSGLTLKATATHDVTGDEYTIDLSDDGGDSYSGDFTTDMPLGFYVVSIFRVSGDEDILLGSTVIAWDGRQKGIRRLVERVVKGDPITWGDVQDWRGQT